MDNVKNLRIPLNKRIQKDNKEKPDFLKVFELFTDDYFIALSEISHDLHFANRYKEFIHEKEGNTPRLLSVYKMSRPNVQKILYKNVQLVCLL